MKDCGRTFRLLLFAAVSSHTSFKRPYVPCPPNVIMVFGVTATARQIKKLLRNSIVCIQEQWPKRAGGATGMDSLTQDGGSTSQVSSRGTPPAACKTAGTREKETKEKEEKGNETEEMRGREGGKIRRKNE